MEENKRYTHDYTDRKKRTNPSSVQVFFKDGSKTPRVEIEYPIGDPNRRKDGPEFMEMLVI